MSKRTKTQQKKIWTDQVTKAKGHLAATNKIRMQIADCAIKACDIKHGGGAHWDGFKKVYTLQKFASDIGIHYKTLSGWVNIRRTFSDVMSLEELKSSKYQTLRTSEEYIRKNKITDPSRKKQIVLKQSKLLGKDNTEQKINKYTHCINSLVSKPGYWKLSTAKRNKLAKNVELLLENMSDKSKVTVSKSSAPKKPPARVSLRL